MTSSYMIAGDSKLERNLGVAPGFPARELKQDELITTNDIMTVLDVKEGDVISTDVSDIFNESLLTSCCLF